MSHCANKSDPPPPKASFAWIFQILCVSGQLNRLPLKFLPWSVFKAAVANRVALRGQGLSMKSRDKHFN